MNAEERAAVADARLALALLADSAVPGVPRDVKAWAACEIRRHRGRLDGERVVRRAMAALDALGPVEPTQSTGEGEAAKPSPASVPPSLFPEYDEVQRCNTTSSTRPGGRVKNPRPSKAGPSPS